MASPTLLTLILAMVLRSSDSRRRPNSP
jgi:hypothetical protein